MDQLQIWRRSTQHALLSLHFSIYDIRQGHKTILFVRPGWSCDGHMAVFKYILILSTALQPKTILMWIWIVDCGVYFRAGYPRDNWPFVQHQKQISVRGDWVWLGGGDGARWRGRRGRGAADNSHHSSCLRTRSCKVWWWLWGCWLEKKVKRRFAKISQSQRRSLIAG